MWRLVGLSAEHGLPFQIHTGHGKLQGSNPLLLVDLIEANPRTKFILFHGGYPWVGETGAIVLRHGSHVWVDSVWLPTISPTMARRALHEWLEVMPSDRILWGADCNHAEGIYGATVGENTLQGAAADNACRGWSVGRRRVPRKDPCVLARRTGRPIARLAKGADRKAPGRLPALHSPHLRGNGKQGDGPAPGARKQTHGIAERWLLGN